MYPTLRGLTDPLTCHTLNSEIKDWQYPGQPLGKMACSTAQAKCFSPGFLLDSNQGPTNLESYTLPTELVLLLKCNIQ